MSDESTDFDEVRRRQLGAFLRTRRGALKPEEVGLARTRYRRVTGLRRDEVASRAGISTAWYTYLEQGREVHPSARVLESLSDALALDADAREHLFQLATARRSPTTNTLDELEDVQWLCDTLSPHPACFLSHRFDLLVWNAAYAELIFDPAAAAPDRRNILWMLFCDDRARARIAHSKESQILAVSFLREISGSAPGDRRLLELIEQLSAESAEFRDTWQRGEVRRLNERQTFTVEHPTAGRVAMETLNLRSIAQPLGVLAVYRLTDDRTYDRLVEPIRSRMTRPR